MHCVAKRGRRGRKRAGPGWISRRGADVHQMGEPLLTAEDPVGHRVERTRSCQAPEDCRDAFCPGEIALPTHGCPVLYLGPSRAPLAFGWPAVMCTRERKGWSPATTCNGDTGPLLYGGAIEKHFYKAPQQGRPPGCPYCCGVFRGCDNDNGARHAVVPRGNHGPKVPRHVPTSRMLVHCCLPSLLPGHVASLHSLLRPPVPLRSDSTVAGRMRGSHCAPSFL